MGAPKKYRGPLSLFEVVALCIVLIAVTIKIMSVVQAKQLKEHEYFSAEALFEFNSLSQKYGPHRFSRNAEEWIIRDYFQDRRNGVFLDVGANHYKDENNTYFLETVLGWSGIAIDALPDFGPDYKVHRPRTQFVALFASDVANSTVQFFVPKDNLLVASSNHDFTVREGAPGTAREVPTTTLNAVLDQTGLKQIDFLSMDIELAEPKALAGFDIDRFQPGLVCIESHADVRQQILDYFAAHRYTVIGKYLRSDPYNLYFKPQGQN